jgi:hypothetical protein
VIINPFCSFLVRITFICLVSMWLGIIGFRLLFENKVIRILQVNINFSIVVVCVSRIWLFVVFEISLSSVNIEYFMVTKFCITPLSNRCCPILVECWYRIDHVMSILIVTNENKSHTHSYIYMSHSPCINKLWNISWWFIDCYKTYTVHIKGTCHVVNKLVFTSCSNT